MRLFVFGLGYSARVLAAAVRAQGGTVTGTHRGDDTTDTIPAPPAPDTPAAAASETGRSPVLPPAGVDAIPLFPFDRHHPLSDPAARAALAAATHILVSIPPDAAGDPVLDACAAGQLTLDGPDLRWVGYLSTTGVYGDHGGAWVDESAERRPTGPRQCRRVEAEDRWLAHQHPPDHWPVHVFRLAGIYGPGRNALEDVRAGSARRIDTPGQVFGRIHVADIAQTLLASMAHPQPGAVYNLADDEPATGAEVVAYACTLLGVEPPPLIPLSTAALSPMAASFYADNKRVDNRRIKQELAVCLHYPSYREGLRALMSSLSVTGVSV